jgi:AcrR family transcriptional regulator
MSSLQSAVAEAPRRHLSSRQAATVERLCEAAVEELREIGDEGLSVRSVAKRAEVAPATAYTYFTSKEHLVTEVFWRRLRALPETKGDSRQTTVERTVATLTELSLLVVDEPELAAACTVSMLASDPDVKLLRDRIGAEMRRRLTAAMGPEVDTGALVILELAISGALVQAGMGHLSYADLPARLADVATRVLEGP